MNKEQIKKYCEQYPEYEKYEWFEAYNGKLTRLVGIDALKAIMPRYERALMTLRNINSITGNIERDSNPISDYLEISEALSQIQIVLEMYNGK